MLRALKWAYDLGVKHERHRIAQYLSSAQAQRYDRMSAFDRELQEEPIISKADAKKRKIEKRFRQKQVDREVVDIISGIFYKETIDRGESFMFPEGEDK